MENNKQKLSTNNLLAVLALVTLLVVAGSILFGKSLYGSLTLNAKVISKKNLAADTLQKNIEAYTKLHDQYQQIQTQALMAEDALPNDPDFTALASQMEVVAGQNGVRLKGISQAIAGAPAEGSATSGAQTLPFTAEIETSYVNAIKMMAALELSTRPVYVKSMAITGSGNNLKINLVTETYYQPKADLTPKTETVK